VVRLLDFLLLGPFARDRDRVLVHRYVDVFRRDAGEVGLQHHRVLALIHVDGREGWLADQGSEPAERGEALPEPVHVLPDVPEAPQPHGRPDRYSAFAVCVSHGSTSWSFSVDRIRLTPNPATGR